MSGKSSRRKEHNEPLETPWEKPPGAHRLPKGRGVCPGSCSVPARPCPVATGLSRFSSRAGAELRLTGGEEPAPSGPCCLQGRAAWPSEHLFPEAQLDPQAHCQSPCGRRCPPGLPWTSQLDTAAGAAALLPPALTCTGCLPVHTAEWGQMPSV